MKLSPKLITIARRLLLGSAGAATLAAAVVVEENIRGNYAWGQVQAEYTARHQPLPLEPTPSPRVADDQNIFKAPIWADLVADSTPPAQFARAQAAAGLEQVNRVRAFAARPFNIPEARKQLVQVGLVPRDSTESDAGAVLTGMQPAAALLDGVCLAVRERPFAAAPTRSIWQGSDLRLGTVYNIAKLLAARAQARIQAGMPGAGYEDTLTLLRLARACEIQPTAILNVLVAMAVAGQAADNLKLANTSHAWTDDQLSELQQAWSDLRIRGEYEQAYRNERAWQITILDQLPQLSRAEKKQLQWPWWMIPGWVQQNKVSICRRSERRIDTIRAFGTPAFGLRLAAVEIADESVRESRSPYAYFARMVSQKVNGMTRSFASDLDFLRAAETALALERYFRQHGRYPVTLDELTPAAVSSLPLQADGTPAKYTVAADGRGFTLEPIAFDTQASESRKWVQGAAAPDAPVAAAPTQSELDRRREIRRESQARTEQP